MHSAIDPAVTLGFALLLAAMIVALALEERLHAKKSLITGLFAMVALLAGVACHILPLGPVQLPNGHLMEMPLYIPSVDWGVIVIILGSSLFIDVVSRSGIFSWTAIHLTRLSRGDPFRLLVAYGILTVVFSALLNNVTAMIIVGALTGVSLRQLQREDLLLGFLVTEGLLTNIGGLLTLISSVPNIIVGNTAGIPFMTFFIHAAPYVVVATGLTLWMARARFGILGLSDEGARLEAALKVDAFDPDEGIESWSFFRLSWGLLAGFILLIAGTSALPLLRELGMGFVAMSFAMIALIRYRHEVDQSYAGVDWDLLFFFIFLFVVIGVMEHAGVLDLLGEGIGHLLALGETVGGGLLLSATAVASSVTDNVPLAAVMAKLLDARGLESTSPLWWSTIFGANLGGNFTPIGSASTVVAVAMIHKQGLSLSFGRFVVMAAPFALAQLILATLYVLFFLQ